MELETFLAHAGNLTIDELEHHGVKGMHWGVKKHSGSGVTGRLTSKDVEAARSRHISRLNALEAHGQALSIAKTKAEKQRHLNEIHKIADEALKSGDIEKSHARATNYERTGYGLAGTVVLPGVGTAAGLASAHAAVKLAGRAHHKLVTQYKNSTLSDYH